MEDEHNILIPIKTFSDEFLCPICMEMIKDCHITACGHNFCLKCVDEWINRKHQCPVCNTPTLKTQLFPNKQFDRLACSIIEEKDKASKQYFESLLRGKNNNEMGNSSMEISNNLSPIESLFQQHMKSSLVTYDEYYQKLKNKSDEKKKQLEEEYTKKMLEHQKNTNTKNKLSISQDHEISRLTAECDHKIKEEEEVFDRGTSLLLKSYEEFLKGITPAPKFLSVTVDIILLEKKIKIHAVLIKPTDTIKELKKLLEAKMEKSYKDPIVCWKPGNIFVIENGQGGIVIQNDDQPIVQYKIDQGSSIIVKGQINCKSDAPKQCFKNTFVKDSNMVVDYYCCKDCQYNWICKSCAESCHKGHEVIDYILQHKPTWACCYCVKKGKCVLYK